MFKDQDNRIFSTDTHIIFWCESYNIFSKRRERSQEEFPLLSLPWFIDTLENDFWNIHNIKKQKNKKTKNIAEQSFINSEEVGMNSVQHCCAENLFGYSFWNKNRACHITGRPPQDWYIPKYMLEEGILDQLKKASTKLGLKDYS